ncbi:MAG TPA: endonuclease Q family protein [Candidatus Nanoarchaeia archaeon]|nr:endonuclease Q family protein [Candidatus Nanoarchaeia archaeon]
MKLFADLHLHSRFSRATSKNLTLQNLEKYARIKGINLLGTGDFTHPKWLDELKEHLAEDKTGILKTKTGFPFVLQTEVSNIFSQDNRLRKVHTVILAKNFEVVSQINEKLSKKGNLNADGRPIFGKYSCIELVEDMKKIDKDIELILAHAWTPWFSVFGSMSGFDSLQECFREKAKHIHAIETGLSSDPPMNWRISGLDGITLVSNSDSHSYWPWRIGRECNILDIDLTYDSIVSAIRTKKGFIGTVEVDPNYGKYHFDGHRNCNVSLHPQETRKLNSRCPNCKNNLTIGVLNRVEELADRAEGFVPSNSLKFHSLLPLHELISLVYGTAESSKKSWEIYWKLIKKFGSEMNVLLEADQDSLKSADEKLVGTIMKNRAGEIKVIPGYDGEYGRPVLDGISRKLKKENTEIKENIEIIKEKPTKAGNIAKIKKTDKIPQKGLKEYFN